MPVMPAQPHTHPQWLGGLPTWQDMQPSYEPKRTLLQHPLPAP